MSKDPTSIDRLHDLVLPPPEPLWPPTPGWSIVLLTIAFIALGFILKWVIRWQSNRYRREAIHLLDHPETTTAMFSSIIKRAALTKWPRSEIADLTGSRWLEFLDRSADMDSFATGPANKLEAAAFDPTSIIHDDALKRAARVWIIQHRRRKEGDP